MTQEHAPTGDAVQTPGKVPGWMVGVGIAILAVVFAYFALGMPGMDHTPADTESDPTAEEHDMGDMGDE